MDKHNNALGREIGEKAKSWEDVVRMAREKISESADWNGDGEDGRATWYAKVGDGWKPDWNNVPITPNPKGGEEHRYDPFIDPVYRPRLSTMN